MSADADFFHQNPKLLLVFLITLIPLFIVSRKIKKKTLHSHVIVIPDGAYKNDDAYEFISKHVNFPVSKRDVLKTTELITNSNKATYGISKELRSYGITLSPNQVDKIMDAETLYLDSISE